jgi:hypothetical protein
VRRVTAGPARARLRARLCAPSGACVPCACGAPPPPPHTHHTHTNQPRTRARHGTQVDAVPLPPGPANPYCNAFMARETDLTTTSAAQRMAAPERARVWKVGAPLSGEKERKEVKEAGVGGWGWGGVRGSARRRARLSSFLCAHVRMHVHTRVCTRLSSFLCVRSPRGGNWPTPPRSAPVAPSLPPPSRPVGVSAPTPPSSRAAAGAQPRRAAPLHARAGRVQARAGALPRAAGGPRVGRGRQGRVCLQKPVGHAAQRRPALAGGRVRGRAARLRRPQPVDCAGAARVCACACTCACACARVCARVRVRVCVRARARARVCVGGGCVCRCAPLLALWPWPLARARARHGGAVPRQCRCPAAAAAMRRRTRAWWARTQCCGTASASRECHASFAGAHAPRTAHARPSTLPAPCPPNTTPHARCVRTRGARAPARRPTRAFTATSCGPRTSP